MATFQGEVTQNGWSVTFETRPEDNQASTDVARGLAAVFIESQVRLQTEGQKYIRQIVERGNTIPPGEGFVNGFPYEEDEAESLQD